MNTERNFSAVNRPDYIEQLNHELFDILVFGGGITGAGIALDAASRGLKVALVEKNDFASGTSSRSTKLVHGGLRYLEKLQLKFVAQLGRERKILHENAAHIVVPTPVLLPIYKHGQLSKWLSYFALKVYDLLANVKPEHKARWINKTKLIEKYPTLSSNHLKGAYKYYEYKTNDGRLVIEGLKQASEYGAICINYMHANKLNYTNNKIIGAELIDALTNKTISIKAKYTVNATGVWSEIFLSGLNEKLSKSLYPTKGIHIVISRSRFQINEAFYFDAHDKRMVFAIPKQNFVYIGTTDTPYTNNFENPEANEEDINYLLEAVNFKFNGLKLKNEDIISTWAGIRPLIKDKSSKPGEVSRKDEVFISETGLITIVGGKLTGYRLMAKKVVDLVLKNETEKWVKCISHDIKLSGSNWQKAPEMHELIEYNDYKYDEAKQTGIQPTEFKLLFYRYGTNIDIITEKAYELYSKMRDVAKLWLKAEVWYSVNYEMTISLIGFFAYRTEKVLFEPNKIENEINFVADCMQEYLHWTDTEKTEQIKQFKREWKQYRVPIK